MRCPPIHSTPRSEVGRNQLSNDMTLLSVGSDMTTSSMSPTLPRASSTDSEGLHPGEDPRLLMQGGDEAASSPQCAHASLSLSVDRHVTTSVALLQSLVAPLRAEFEQQRTTRDAEDGASSPSQTNPERKDDLVEQATVVLGATEELVMGLQHRTNSALGSPQVSGIGLGEAASSDAHTAQGSSASGSESPRRLEDVPYRRVSLSALASAVRLRGLVSDVSRRAAVRYSYISAVLHCAGLVLQWAEPVRRPSSSSSSRWKRRFGASTPREHVQGTDSTARDSPAVEVASPGAAQPAASHATEGSETWSVHTVLPSRGNESPQASAEAAVDAIPTFVGSVSNTGASGAGSTASAAPDVSASAPRRVMDTAPLVLRQHEAQATSDSRGAITLTVSGVVSGGSAAPIAESESSTVAAFASPLHATSSSAHTVMSQHDTVVPVAPVVAPTPPTSASVSGGGSVPAGGDGETNRDRGGGGGKDTDRSRDRDKARTSTRRKKSVPKAFASPVRPRHARRRAQRLSGVADEAKSSLFTRSEGVIRAQLDDAGAGWWVVGSCVVLCCAASHTCRACSRCACCR